MKYVVIGEHQFEYDHFELYTDMYRNASRNVMKVYCPNTVLPADIGTYLSDSDLDSITFVDDQTDHYNSNYITNTTYKGYALVLGYGLDYVLVSHGDPQGINNEEYVEYTTFKLAQLTRQEKKLLDLGIDPWADVEDLSPVVEEVPVVEEPEEPTDPEEPEEPSEDEPVEEVGE